MSTDSLSYANFHEVVTTNISIDWAIDFNSKKINGSVKHDVKVLNDLAKYVNFDSRSLQIEKIVIFYDNKIEDAVYNLGLLHPVLGNKISIEIPESLRKADSIFGITFYYSVDSAASAVQWLDKKATNGGVYPYIFTQCQAIHARSLLPCMDTPGVKATYNAVVKAPEWCTVLMSALADTKNTTKGLFCWNQPVAIPAYLIALAAGNLSSIDISPRVRVWSEPEVVADAAEEFSQTEDFLSTAESLTCPYLWTRYDILVLPSSFPYGGMENPCLTFATPTILAGDKSLANVIAHEIAHSWTGNLVTNQTWDHAWLNEGLTVWLERNIMAKIANDENVLKLSAQGGWKRLLDDISRYGNDSAYTSLVWSLGENDPDDASSAIPYEKGFCFLYYLENLVGSDNFHLFIKSYIEKFKFSTVTSDQFKSYFIDYFKALFNNKTDFFSSFINTFTQNEEQAEIMKKIDAIDWDSWLLSPGLPPIIPDYTNTFTVKAEELCKKWIVADARGNYNALMKLPKTTNWSSEQICTFLDSLLLHVQEESPFSVSTLESLDKIEKISNTKNAEIKFRWFILALTSEAEWIIKDVVDFLGSQGRLKFIRPLYKQLKESKVGSKIAVSTFKKFIDRYHPIAKKIISKDLNLSNYSINSTNSSIIPTTIASANTKSNIEEKVDSLIVLNQNRSIRLSKNSKEYIKATSFLVLTTGFTLFTIKYLYGTKNVKFSDFFGHLGNVITSRLYFK